MTTEKKEYCDNKKNENVKNYFKFNKVYIVFKTRGLVLSFNVTVSSNTRTRDFVFQYGQIFVGSVEHQQAIV